MRCFRIAPLAVVILASSAEADIITGAGPGAPGGHVKAFDGATGAEVRSFLAFPGFDGGVYVAGTPEVVPQAVPEPSSVLLLTFGGLSLALQRRRRA
ncbi:MAG: PEP-CTERM sorting domain-containing protein [Gemmataceae bacterium]|nr:PEP-CTERM sorting domain-containing protein [Gemmataceae bacterium]